MSGDERDVLSDLAELPARDAEKERARRVGVAAAHAFALHADPTRAMAARAGRVITPVVLVGTVCVYLTWAVTTASALFH